MFLHELSPGETFEGFLLVKSADIRTSRNNTTFVDLQLFDGKTEIKGEIWDHKGTSPAVSSIIKIQGILGEYNGSPQLTIAEWEQAKEGEYSPEKFLPSYQGDRESLFLELWVSAEDIADFKLQELVCTILGKNKGEFMEAPAAVKYHHAYLGGLLEHTWKVHRIALDIARNSPEFVNFDLIRAGAILYDIGKIQSYNWEGCLIQMSDDGRLLDHIVLGAMIVQNYCNKIQISQETVRNLLHIIISHHGKPEWGSPIAPATKEAMIVHRADETYAKIEQADEALQFMKETNQKWGQLKGDKTPIFISNSL